MDYADIQNVLASPVAKRLLEGDELARLAYIATDGTPRAGGRVGRLVGWGEVAVQADGADHHHSDMGEGD